MNLIKFEPLTSQQTREKVSKKVLECDSFIIIYNNKGEHPSYQWVAMGDSEAISILELTKFHLLNEIMNG